MPRKRRQGKTNESKPSRDNRDNMFDGPRNVRYVQRGKWDIQDNDIYCNRRISGMED